MNKAAFYGYMEFFDQKDIDYSDEDIGYCMFLGSKRNLEFALMAYEHAEIYTDEIADILLVNDVYIDHSIFTVYDNFKYISRSICELLSKKGYELVSFVVVLNDWFDLYNNILSKEAYSLSLYLERYKYISLCNYKYDVSESYFFRYLNIIIDYNEEYEQSDYDDIDIIEFREFTKREIVNNYDIARLCFKNGDRSNLVLSKLINTDIYKYYYLIDEYKPFLLYTKDYNDLRMLTSYFHGNFKYNILYIRMLNSVLDNNDDHYYIHSYYIDLPEYNLYIIAKKYCLTDLLDRIIELYKEHGKLYKILDLENEKYIYEEYTELPVVEKCNVLTGDELNPNNIYF